jgi:DNA-binding sugar fermentation-stimulating protein
METTATVLVAEQAVANHLYQQIKQQRQPKELDSRYLQNKQRQHVKILLNEIQDCLLTQTAAKQQYLEHKAHTAKHNLPITVVVQHLVTQA